MVQSSYFSLENCKTEMGESLEDLQFTLLSAPSTVMALSLKVLGERRQQQSGKASEVFKKQNLVL